jgi:hypothetical protein
MRTEPPPRIIECRVTTDYDRYVSCPAVRECLSRGALLNNWEKVAGQKLRIFPTPLPPNVGSYSEFCPLPHWRVCREDSQVHGHDSTSWV